MKFLELWFSHLIAESSLTLRSSYSARGECYRLGGIPWFAAVKLVVAPSNVLQVENVLDESLLDILENQGLYEQIIFGVLDVMLTHRAGPVKNFNLTIVDVEIDAVKTTPKAVRMAARDAALKILAEAKVYPPVIR